MTLKMKHEIPVGARVRMHYNSMYLAQCGGTDGVVTAHYDDSHAYQVEWDNEHRNSYRPEDIFMMYVSNRSSIQTLKQY